MSGKLNYYWWFIMFLIHFNIQGADCLKTVSSVKANYELIVLIDGMLSLSHVPPSMGEPKPTVWGWIGAAVNECCPVCLLLSAVQSSLLHYLSGMPKNETDVLGKVSDDMKSQAFFP